MTSNPLPWYLDLSERAWEQYRDPKVPVLVLDFETTNLDKGDPRNPDNRIVTTCVNVNDLTFLDNEAWIQLEFYSGKPLILVAHHAKFELGWLNREGIDTSQWLVWDTMIAEYVLAGNRRWELSLDATSQRYGFGSKGRLIDHLMKSGVCPSEMPRRMLEERVLWDVDKTHKLFDVQRVILDREGLLPVMFTRCIFTPVLAHMETYGMLLDRDRVIAAYEKAVHRRADLARELVTLAKGKKLRGPQLAQVLYEDLGFAELTDYKGNVLKTDTGRPKGDATTIMALKAITSDQKRFQELIREHNKIDSAISKSLEFFMKVVQEKGGTFVANFHQTRTATHRLSSSGKPQIFSDGKERSAQLQNLPNDFKDLFRARMGYVIVDVDGSQLEFRVGGSLGSDPQVLRDVETGADIHRYTASVLSRIAEDSVTKEQRRLAKAHTFKPMYGGNSGTARQKEYYAAFREKYKAMNETQKSWTMEVLKTGELRTATGLKFYWPGTKMHRSGYIDNTPSIFDYPIQSLATADIIPVGIVYTFWELRAQGVDALIKNTVHDNIKAEVKKEDLDKFLEIVIKCFLDKTYEYLSRVYGIELYVPLGVTYRYGEFWGDGEEVNISYPMGGKSERIS